MVRAGVRRWTATVVAAGFLLFGPGQENILWAFQMSFVGALMFGLVQLILSNHDGPIGRRDGAALLAGTAALMCSGVALPMVAVVGLAALVRRGWKAAALQVLPLAGLYGIWYLATSPGGIDNPYGRNPTVTEIGALRLVGVRGTFVALGAYPAIGVLLAVVLFVGAWLAWTDRRTHRRLVAPAALLGGALLFLVGTSFTRWFVTPTADSQSRYLYTLAALVFPALAVAVDAVIARWRLLTPLVFAVLLIATVKNATDFNNAAVRRRVLSRPEAARAVDGARTVRFPGSGATSVRTPGSPSDGCGGRPRTARSRSRDRSRRSSPGGSGSS